MSHAVNVTVRGDFATHRPPYNRRILTYANSETQALVEGGLFQGRCFFTPDSGPGCLMAAISGNLFQFQIVGNTVTVTQVNTPATAQSATAPQHWLWQSEKWVIWNDGINNPVFYQGNSPTSITRSNYGTPVSFSTPTAVAKITIPAKNTATAAGDYFSVTGLNAGDIVTVQGYGTFQVIDNTAGAIILLNLTAGPVGFVIPLGKTVSWQHSGTQLPPGRMGAYGRARNWVCLIDGIHFVASDIDGGSSGTAANNFRDAVLNITENSYLAGGGVFSSSAGPITAMRFVSQLDASLGQGPLQVCTATVVYSVNSPTDRTTWQDLTNPILSESLISNGAKGQDSTVLANSDLIFRSIDGIRSLIMARQEENTWGRNPISLEVDDILRFDDPGLLTYGSAIVFDNRLLMTTAPVQHAQGVYWKGMIPLNFDPNSSLRGKLPSVYDSGVWSGMNVLSLVLGQFNDVERGFAFVLNTTTGATKIELWEILPDQADANGNTAPTGRYDNDGTQDIPIVWRFRSASLKFGQDDPRRRELLKLVDGEIYVEDLVNTVQFESNFWPDQYPCPVPWFSWSECQSSDDSTLSKPGFRPRMGLGMPNNVPCDPSNDRPLNEAYTFMLDLTVRGHCVFLGSRLKAITQPQAEFSKPSCAPICS